MQDHPFSQLYKQQLGLLTDFYQLTMAYGYWKSNRYNQEAIFQLFYRKNPFKGQFAIASGLEQVITYLQQLSFSLQDIQYLAQIKGSDGKNIFSESFLNYLQRWKFQCSIDAIPEGTIVFPNQPLIRVQGPLIQAQLIETALLNFINFSTLIATKASRIVRAAQGDPVLDFGLRRAQGVDGGLTASRAAYIGGCASTSNVLAGKWFGIPISGTQAHSWVMCFENELEAFETYAKHLPNNGVFLVDTYDTIQGVKHAIQVGRQLRERGYSLKGIRLDSGDLLSLSKEARQLLDEAGFPKASIAASNDLDEYKINELKAQGAKINVWGVGTRLITAFDQPALGGVYKLSALKADDGNWSYKIKLSEQKGKRSIPGALQVRRILHQGSKPIGDVMYNIHDGEPEGEMVALKNEKVFKFDQVEGLNLLEPIFDKGKLVYKMPSLNQIREKTRTEIQTFKKIDLNIYPISLDKKVNLLTNQLIEQRT